MHKQLSSVLSFLSNLPRARDGEITPQPLDKLDLRNLALARPLPGDRPELSFLYRGDNIVIVVDLREGNVFQLPRNIVTTFLICACVILAGCASPKLPEVRILSDEEASELWDKAESYKPVGEAVTKTFPSSAGTIVTTSQVYSLRMSGRPGLSVVTVCGGSCQLKPGGTFGSCVTSGCVPSGKRCTPLVCSGSCEVSKACSAESSIGIFAH